MKATHKHRLLRPLAVLAVPAVTVMSAQAATIAFEVATAVTSATVLDAPYTAGYTFVSAMNIGDNAKTFNTPGGTSITFAAGNTTADLGDVNMPAGASGTTGYYNGQSEWNAALFSGDTGITAFNDILDGQSWHTNVSDATRPLTLRLTGLTVGTTYAVYLYASDARAGSAGRTQAYWDTFSGGTFSGGTSGSFSYDTAKMVKGTFTADAAFQDIFIEATDSVGANDDTTLAAYTLYQVPEPSSALLLTGAGLLLGFRRNRR